MKLKIHRIQARFKSGLYGFAATIVVIGLGVLWATRPTRAEAPAGADSAAVPVAGVVKISREDLFKEVTIPAEFRPYVEVELHAKVSGYVKQMNVDFGDQVKAGELLATLEVPELQDELRNTMAAEQKAEADYANANLIYTRLLEVNRAHPNLVAQQDLDTAQANDLAAAAAAAAAKADVEKYQTLVGYTQITAPFDGVVTRRFADPGALIQAGTSSATQSLPLVRVSDNYRLRLDFPVTVDYVKDIHLGDSVAVRVDSLNRMSFTGTISRFTDDVSENTRTMNTEIEVPNPDLKLVPGMYATVTLNVEKRPHALAVPIEAVVGDNPPVVYVVNQNHQIEERSVKLGLETPDKYEVLAGLREGDLAVIGSHSRLQIGQKVEPKLVELSLRDEN
ncbi:MAG TPA: efflux RND transporter periplasmic adaptor subunit [Candidatus Sulfopaludibacter sp.]|nr:efflux RND transporter periplasmic adaptor subunit [Candidatus Sulfopaludibacter sp.]